MSATDLSVPRPGPRPSRSRAEIVGCALRMLDRDGPETLTFRAVARELDMTVGALSRYFKNLADLEDEVAAQIMSEPRPLDANSKSSLRDQLLRLSLDIFEIARARPYLVKIHGPASAAAVGRMTQQCIKVMLDAGIDFERAMSIYSLIGAMPNAWAMASQRPANPQQEALAGKAYMEALGDLAPQMSKLLGTATGTTLYRRWLTAYLDALLATPASAGKAR